MEFHEWLIKEKNYQRKSAYDVNSHLRRAKKILGTEDLSIDAINEIEKNKDFKNLTRCVRSQIRIALRRYNEYETSNIN